MTQPDVVIRPAQAADDDILTALGYEYLSWAIERLRAEYAVEWPSLTPNDVRDGLEAYRSRGIALGAGIVRLDTIRFMSDAQRLYRSRQVRRRKQDFKDVLELHVTSFHVVIESRVNPLHAEAPRTLQLMIWDCIL